MGIASNFTPEKLMCGILYQDLQQCNLALKILQEHFGSIDLQSQSYSFSQHSSYYDNEMNGEVHRIFISFSRLVDPASLADIKIATNQIELSFAHDTLRPINLDPGLINTGRLILATTKDAAHRFALKDGIYGELTLFYSRKVWQVLPWTYPDFRTQTTHAILNQIRKLYRSALREASC
jgi:Domain of unknown function (DUF4416)